MLFVFTLDKDITNWCKYVFPLTVSIRTCLLIYANMVIFTLFSYNIGQVIFGVFWMLFFRMYGF